MQGVLRELEENEYGPYVVMLPRQAGRKESRYAHLFCGEVDEAAVPEHSEKADWGKGAKPGNKLEQEVDDLKARLSALEERVDEFVKQFE